MQKLILGIMAAMFIFGFLQGTNHTARAEDKIILYRSTGGVYDRKLMLLSLQGIVNREKPQLYLVFSADELRWKNWYEQNYGLQFETIDSLPELIERFKNQIKGYIIFDRKSPHSSNIALTMAGLMDGVICSERDIEKLDTAGLKVLQDLRGKFDGMSTAEIYKWGYENLWKKCNKKIMGNFPVPRFKGTEEDWVIQGHSPIDYVVSKKGFCQDLSSRIPEERAIKDKFLSEMEPLGLVLGWVDFRNNASRDDEGSYVTQFTQHGITQICSQATYNLSIHSKIKPKEKYSQDNAKPEDIKLEDKVYLTFYQSDGDALWALNNGFEKSWFSKNRGIVPMGWEIQPLIIDLAPAILDYYYATKTEKDYFLGAVSGIGYIYPDKFPENLLDKYLVVTDGYLQKLDMKVLFLMPGSTPFPEKIKQKYSQIVKSCYGFLYGYHPLAGEKISFVENKFWLPTDYAFAHFSGQKVIRSMEDIKKDIEDIGVKKSPGVPLFVGVHNMMCGHGATIDEVKYLLDNLDPQRYKIVRPDEFCAAAVKYYQSGPIIQSNTIFCKIVSENVITGRIDNYTRESISGKVSFELPKGWKTKPEQLNVVIPAGSSKDINFSCSIPSSEKNSRDNILIKLQTAAGKVITGKIVVNMQKIYEATGPGMGHNTGKQVDDKDALNGKAWKGTIGKDEPGKHLSFGPYTKEILPGNIEYDVVFRMKVSDNSSGGDVVTIDAHQYLGAGVLDSRTIKANEFDEKNKYKEFVLTFSAERIQPYEGNVYGIEFRIFWLGETDLSIDRITLR